MTYVRGPVFANMILADEINRTPPKTQAALLEAMQEHQVTAAGVRHPLDEPFFVLATQNPIEMEGTYPLPEAQLDRFMFDVVVSYLSEDDEVRVVTQTTGIDAPAPGNMQSFTQRFGVQCMEAAVARGVDARAFGGRKNSADGDHAPSR